MPAVRRFAPTRPAHPAHRPLRGPDDALSVLLAGGGPPPPCIALLLLDGHHRGLACLEVGRRADTDAVLDAVDTVLAAAEAEPGLAAVVLATFRAGEAYQPAPGEEECFAVLRDLCGEVGLELIDWFVVANGFSTSLAELTGAASWWEPDGGEV